MTESKGAKRSASAEQSGGLAVTALYTAEVWRREGFPGAELLASPDARRVFGATDGALRLARLLGGLGRWLRGERWSPLPVALAHRHALIDRWAQTHDAEVVLELASGLSPRGAWLSSLSERTVVEVDLPEMMATKRRLLGSTPEGKAALARAHWHFVEGDLREMELWRLVPPGRRTLVIAEGLFMYLDAEAQRGLMRRVADLLATRGGTLIFDLVPPAEEPRPGLLGRALGWLMRRFTRGADFVRERRTRADLLADLEAAGFVDAQAVEPHAQALALRLPHPETWTRMVVFRAERVADPA